MLQDINEISDGKIYGVHDMVRVGCSDCEGCHSCCEQMGDTVLVDPYDCKRLETELGMGFEQLMQSCVGLHVEEGLIVPHLKMQEQTDTCVFLNEAGRCSIMHTVRASADYFLWEEFMRSRVFPIFYRVVPVNAAKRKSKWKNG